MIAFLRGKIINKGESYLILNVNDIGYRIFINQNFLADLTIGENIEIYTHQYVREDTLNLYGFRSNEELELFELLLSISGIGPKSALAVLSVASVSDIKESIARGDSLLLTKVSGIGRKIAERVVLELREKIVRLGATGESLKSGYIGRSDEIDALMVLGYSMSQARIALDQVDSKIKDSSERIRQALKKLGK